jgi:hypothetical protein
VSWVAFAGPAVASLALIAILGLPVSFALRLRGFAVAVVAVPAAFAVVAISSIVAPVIGVSWSLLPPLAVAVLLAAVLLLLRRWLGASERVRNRVSAAAGRRDLLVSLGAAAIGGAVFGPRAGRRDLADLRRGIPPQRGALHPRLRVGLTADG